MPTAIVFSSVNLLKSGIASVRITHVLKCLSSIQVLVFPIRVISERLPADIKLF